MEAALKKAGSPVETLYVRNEGHGFYSPANQRTYYSRLLAFLSRSLGTGGRAGRACGKEQRALSTPGAADDRSAAPDFACTGLT